MGLISSIFNSDKRRARKRFDEKYKRMKERSGNQTGAVKTIEEQPQKSRGQEAPSISAPPVNPEHYEHRLRGRQKATRLWVIDSTAARLELQGAQTMSVEVPSFGEDRGFAVGLRQWATENLTRRAQQIIALVLFAAICYGFLGVVGDWYSEANDRNHVNLWNQQRFEDFYALPMGWLDMVFLGSSHSFTTFDPAQFYGRWNAFQMGMPLQTPDSSFFTLMEVYNHQQPSIVVMELYWNVMNRDFVPAQLEGFFRVLDNRELQEKYISRVMPVNEQVKHNIEAIRFQEAAFAFANAWIRDFTSESDLFYEEGFVQDVPVGIQYYRSLGYVYSSYVMTATEFDRIRRTPAQRLNFSIAPRQRYFLEEMVRLTREEGSRLIFVTAPISNVSLANILDYDAIHREISGFAELHGIPYLDFNLRNLELGMFADYMFMDHGHLNHTGAMVAGAYFMGWLTEVLEGGA